MPNTLIFFSIASYFVFTVLIDYNIIIIILSEQFVREIDFWSDITAKNGQKFLTEILNSGIVCMHAYACMNRLQM